MVRINKQVLKSVSVPVLWGGLWLCEALGFVFMLKEWREYTMWCDLMLTETFRMDAFYVKLLYAFCISMSCLLVLTALVFYVSLSRCLKFLKSEEKVRSEESMSEVLPSVHYALHVDTFGGIVSYEGNTVRVAPRVALFLNVLVKKENHTLTLEEFNEIFNFIPYEKLGCSKSKIRNMKYYARQALKSMPFDVVSDSSGSFFLVYIDNKESRFINL